MVDEVNVHFFASTIVFEFSAHPGDAHALLGVLRAGTATERGRQELARGGTRHRESPGPESSG